MRVDVLAVMDRDRHHAAAYRQAHGYADGTLEDAVREAGEARAAVVELIEAAKRAEVAFNTVGGCYVRNPGNFMLAMRQLNEDVKLLRAALARCQPTEIPDGLGYGPGNPCSAPDSPTRMTKAEEAAEVHKR